MNVSIIYFYSTVTYLCDGQTLTFSAYEAAGNLKAVYVPTKYVSCGTHATVNPKVDFNINAGTQANPAKGTITAANAGVCNYNPNPNVGDIYLTHLFFS